MLEAAAVESQIIGEHMFLRGLPSLESVMERLKATDSLGLGSCVTKVQKHKM